jgi:hypothetical protein
MVHLDVVINHALTAVILTDDRNLRRRIEKTPSVLPSNDRIVLLNGSVDTKLYIVRAPDNFMIHCRRTPPNQSLTIGQPSLFALNPKEK